MDISTLSNENKRNIYVECLGGYTSIAFLKRCPGYTEAKKNGDKKAAEKVIDTCVDECQVSLVREKYPEAILIPVISVTNTLPIAFADRIGLVICLSVRSVKTESRKSLSAMERILNKPHFYGFIETNKSYILVDDIMTQGGTFSALIRFVVESGGYVCAVIVLAYAKWSRKLTSKYKNSIILTARFGDDILDFFRGFGIGEDEICYFTHSEMSYLLKFVNVSNMKKKLKKDNVYNISKYHGVLRNI